ncbi:MAG: alkaline phosphatase family protein [bacterium]|nr:alkaline phosphatase family protein [bacterium]
MTGGWRKVAFCLAGSLLFACAGEPPPPPEGTPRLVLFLVIDQGCADYFERFAPLLDGGLGRLLEESTVFTQTYHDHGVTTTAPGHATLSTGVYPSRHGIVNNWWLDRESVEVVAAVGEEQTPEAMQATTLGDWLKSAYPRSKVFAASTKDRGAILTAGHSADAAFWSNWDDSRFVSSEYYPGGEPEWLEAYRQKRFPDRYFGKAWEPLPEVVEHGADYGLQPLGRGLIDRQFPHAIGSPAPAPDDSFYRAFWGNTPFGDAYLVDFATALIDGEQLGQDAYPDFLGLSFSATDIIGHGYGPDSPELLDTLLRLDEEIGKLLDFVDRRIGLEHTIVSLSADHGVTPLPELLRAKGIEARRFAAEDILCFQRSRDQLRRRFGDRRWFLGGFYVDRVGVAAAGVDPEEIENETRRLIEQCPGVARVWTSAERNGSTPPEDEVARLYANSYHPERSPDLQPQYEAHTLLSRRSATTHGSPYPYDTHVPWLLRLPAGRGARVDATVHTVDVAPTLAPLLAVTPPAGLDGVDRRSLIDQRSLPAAP